jgi:replicative DNA helicase
MTAAVPKYTTALSVARSAALDLDAKPERWKCGPPFDALDLRPGRVILFGAPPATGKTTAVGQIVADALTHQPNLRAVLGNVEMSAEALTEKFLARFAAVPLEALQNRELLPDERARVERAKEEHAGLLERVAFLDPPFTLPHLAGAMVDFRARLCVVDYAQRFATGTGDDRVRLDDLMSGVRKLATAGACVLLVSSVARQKSSSGSSTYDGLGLASFRGSSELEFGADLVFIIDADVKAGVAVLRCVKDRFRLPRDIPLRFDAARQTFTTGDALDAYDAAPEPRKKEKKK